MPTAGAPSKFSRVALIGKPGSDEIAASLSSLRELLEKRGCEVVLDTDKAAKCDLAVVVGGDGTMLTAARALLRHHVPLTGVNQGRVGFMTDIGYHDMKKGVESILDGQYSIEERAALEAEVFRGGEIVSRAIALNDVVVGRGAEGRMIEFSLAIDGEFVYKLRGDGVIVATPTGSTAYALSAQGPILHPAVEALALVPLNPHTLSARPVSISDRSTIEITLEHAMDGGAHFDGVVRTELRDGDRVVIKRSADAVRFVHPPGYRYFATLREKLRWSEVLDKQRTPE
jgi:NAD+ kinase